MGREGHSFRGHACTTFTLTSEGVAQNLTEEKDIAWIYVVLTGKEEGAKKF